MGADIVGRYSLGLGKIPFIVSGVDENLERTVSGQCERDENVRRVDRNCRAAKVFVNEQLAGDADTGPEPWRIAGYVPPAPTYAGEDKRRLDGGWVHGSVRLCTEQKNIGKQLNRELKGGRHGAKHGQGPFCITGLFVLEITRQ